MHQIVYNKMYLLNIKIKVLKYLIPKKFYYTFKNLISIINYICLMPYITQIMIVIAMINIMLII